MPHATPLSGDRGCFDRLRTTLFCEKADRVPALELLHDLGVKEAFLGRPVRTFADDIEFHYLAGYDYYNVRVSCHDFRRAIDARPARPTTVTGSPYGHLRERRWSPEHNALFRSLDEFEAFPWPCPGDAQLDLACAGLEPVPLPEGLVQIRAVLPVGMGRILSTDGIFERFTKDMMGYETFCYMLHDQPELVGCMFARVGEL